METGSHSVVFFRGGVCPGGGVGDPISLNNYVCVQLWVSSVGTGIYFTPQVSVLILKRLRDI